MAMHDVIMAWLKAHALWVMLWSVLLFGVGMGIAVLVAVMLPADFFIRDRSAEIAGRRHPVLRFALRLLKNVAGLVLVIAGGLMALPMVPGPGLLLVILGLSLIDFPPLRRLERRVLGSRLVLTGLNAFRSRWNQPPLQIPAPAPRRAVRIRKNS